MTVAEIPPELIATLEDLLAECLDDYDWQTHLAKYPTLRKTAVDNYEAIHAARSRGEDVTDMVLERLLPHGNTSHNRKTGRWIHVAPSITRNIKDWYEASGWTDPEDWPVVASLILEFVDGCVEAPETLEKACEDFADHPLSTGFQSGTMSPILNALRPDDFGIINNKSRKLLNYFLNTSHGPNLREYPTANADLGHLVREIGPIFTAGALGEYRAGDVFDMLIHWLVSKKDYPPTPQKTKHWKISPGANAKYWPECRDRGYIAIGWNDLGDIAGMSLKQFEARRDELLATNDSFTKTALNQVWRFSRMSVGDVVIANRGTGEVVGIGEVTGDYYFDANASGLRHRVPVEWTDTVTRKVDQPGWRRTLLKLDERTFAEIENATIIEGDVVLAPVDDIEPSDAPAPAPTPLESAENIVLFGPPGTGKTWSTKRRAVELCLRPDEPLDDEEIDTEYDRLRHQGRIDFLTFHQSFAYEEFVEGIRPVISDDDEDNEDNQVVYQCEPGVFKALALRAAAEGVEVARSGHTFETLWYKLIEQVRAAEEQDGTPTLIENYKGDEYALTATAQDNLRAWRVRRSQAGISLPNNSLGASKTYSRALWDNRDTLGDDPDDYSFQRVSRIVSRELGTGGGCHGHILWAVHFKLRELATELDPSATQRELTQDQRISLLKDYLRRSDRSEIAVSYEDAPDYVLVIDEINRGNMSKILGELITLLEPSKRLTEKDELIAQLPYSKEHFAVPPNLHIIGTMNTADRSIALMDAALRRRFSFEEVLPDWRIIGDHLDASVSADVYGGKEDFLNLVIAVFCNINARIEFLYDRDHMLGHSYLLDVTGFETLRAAFTDQVIPLLQEYFYSSWDRLCLALGCPYDEQGTPARADDHGRDGHQYRAPLVTVTSLVERDLLGLDHGEYRDQLRFELNPRILTGGLAPEELRQFFVGVLSGDHLADFRRHAYYSEDQ